MHEQPTTSAMMRAYRERWQAVEAIEIVEQRVATVKQRWQGLNAVIGLAIGLHLPMNERADEQQARERWAKLKGAGNSERGLLPLTVADSSPQWMTQGGTIMNEHGELQQLRGALVAVQRLIERFDDQGMVIGGVAASLLGKERLTRDVDVTLLLGIEDITMLLQAASEEHLVPRTADVEVFARTSRVVLLTHQPSNINVDISLGVLPFEVEAVERSQAYNIGSLVIRLPTPEDLIIMKAIAHRPRDLQDIYDLIQTHPQLDRQHIQFWLEQFAELLELPEIWTDVAKWL